jgi:hypothetical protein
MQSPQLDVADKRISSPVYIIQHRKDDHVPDHQFHFFANDGIEGKDLKNELFSFGERMKRQIQKSPLHWKGFGTLRYASSEMLFEPDEIKLASLEAVPAEKVLRKNVQHSMLVGDQEMTSQQVTEVLTKVEHKRSWFMILGWVLLIISIVAIIIYLYMKNFETSSTGLGTW